jgi:hypothetical protein
MTMKARPAKSMKGELAVSQKVAGAKSLLYSLLEACSALISHPKFSLALQPNTPIF